ncbi:MAG: hypothetical protein A2505_03355 [Deltaproteobacteria bacterium RIFOXYD12_FULL_55_16]|nr:MAG: hypothetical protein A2505_03355 [Deltaproteobacteria bacterium RIFOXYD12_FULL_55_16]
MFDNYNKKFVDERGFVLVGALLILLLLVLIGISASNSTFFEIQIAASHKARAKGFYAAESGLSYAKASPEFYGGSNVTEGSGLRFPAGTAIEIPEDSATRQALGVDTDQSFQGTITYEGSGALPRGSGFSDDYNAHFYEIQSTGYGPNGAEVTVEVRAYRVGF